MPWYYAGPEAKPVGPVTLEELHARRLSGALTADTYVIEHSGAPGTPGAWRHYREIFPESAALPPLPPAPAFPPPPVAASPGHPLFPSAAHVPLAPHPAYVPAAAPHAHYPARRTNGWCAWGFGLGLAGFIFSFACGAGLLLAVPALIICILGFIQVQQRPDQSGKGLAVAGAVLSGLALLIAIGFFIYTVPIMIKNHAWTVTEQSSTNSE
jgi:hypothetical protein